MTTTGRAPRSPGCSAASGTRCGRSNRPRRFEAADVAGLALDCLIVDVRLPGVSGPELRDRLRGRGMLTPVVFITGDAGVRIRRTRGTLTVVKPFDGETLLAAVDAAISAAHDSDARHAR